jgi:hypothetical protein
MHAIKITQMEIGLARHYFFSSGISIPTVTVYNQPVASLRRSLVPTTWSLATGTPERLPWSVLGVGGTWEALRQ